MTKPPSKLAAGMTATLLLCLGPLAGPGSAISPIHAAGKLRAEGRGSVVRSAPVTPAAESLAAFDALDAAADGQLAVTWNANGAALAVYGPLGNYGGAAETAARAFLASNKGLFGLRPDVADLALESVRETPGGTHYTFRQEYAGLPVYGGSVSVSFDPAGDVSVAGGEYKSGVALDSVAPDLAPEDARAALLARTGSRPSGEASLDELVVYVTRKGASRLAYHVIQPTADETGAAETYEGFVDAHTGRVIGRPRDVNQYATGKVFAKGNAMAATGNSALKDTSSIPSTAYSTVTLQGLTSSSGLVGQYADCYSTTASTYRATPDASGNYTYTRSTTIATGAKFDAVNTYYYVDAAERYIQSLGFTNVNNRSVRFNVNGQTDDNSHYSPNGSGTGDLTLGSGGVDDAEDAEVVLHEYGHSIHDNSTKNIWGTDGVAGVKAGTGAMGEGFGDYFATSVTASQFGQSGTAYQATCMEWDAAAYSSAVPPTIRPLNSTKHYPENVDGEVHDDGEMWSATLWQIRNDIGAARADKVVLQSHFLLTSSAATFVDGANAILTAAANLGYTQAEKDAIRARFVARGVLASTGGGGTPVTLINEGAETGAAGWTVTGGSWSVDATGPHAGTKSFHSVASGATQYGTSVDSSLVSPAFSLSGKTSATVTFYYKYKTELTYDKFSVDYSTNGGTSWTALRAAASGTSTGWSAYAAQASYALPTGSSTVKLRFRFTSDTSVVDTGAYVDDVVVTAQ